MINLIEEVKERIPLRPLLDAYLGQSIRDRYRCQFGTHEDNNPSVKVTPDGQNYKCWSCPAKGTVIDLVMRFEGIIKPFDAAKFLAEKYLGQNPADWPKHEPKPRSVVPKGVKVGPEHWRDASWQAAADELVKIGEHNLDASVVGRPARDWLASQGVNMITAKRRRLGFYPETVESVMLDLPIGPHGAPGPIVAPRGLVFPWLAPHAHYAGNEPCDGPRWCGANIRRFGPDLFGDMPSWLKGKKYKTFEGSERGHGYPFPTIDASQAGISAWIFEGERDALLCEQEAGHLVHALSVGGASQSDIRPSTLAALACCPWWFVVGDRDAPGIVAAQAWIDRAGGKGRRPHLPHGKDLCEFAAQGGDVRAWIESELAARSMLNRPFVVPPSRSDRWIGLADDDLGDGMTGMGDAFEGDLPDDLPRLI